MAVPGREAAYRALCAFRKNKIWSGAYLDGLIKREKLDARESAFVTRLLLGVLQNMSLLDFYIHSYSKKDSIDAEVLDILRLGAYQIAFMDKVPERAAVSEGVELAKRHTRKSAGFVNAVLRRIAENKHALPLVEPENLALKYSHPEPLTAYLASRLGFEETELFLKHNNEIHEISVRLNPLKTDLAGLEESFTQSGANFRKNPRYDGFYFLKQQGAVEKLEAFKEGFFTVQDPAASVLAGACAVKPGMKVLDACAAPGGKCFLLAGDMGNNGEIIACDINEKKLKKVSEGALRLGVSIIETRHADASKPIREFSGTFDIVLCDAPCSGLGVIAKKPEIRYKSFSDIERLPEIQLAVLKNLSGYVKPGGLLIYSTCTVVQAENEDVVDAFLGSVSGFACEAFAFPGNGERVPEGQITLWPQRHGTDGFFICKMRKDGSVPLVSVTD